MIYSWFEVLFTPLSPFRHEEGGALGGGVDALKNLIRAGGAGCRMLTELSIRGLGLTCSSMLQVQGAGNDWG